MSRAIVRHCRSQAPFCLGTCGDMVVSRTPCWSIQEFAYLFRCQIACVVGVHSTDGDAVRVAICDVVFNRTEGIGLVCQ
eukprot:3068173-Pleurochrysis_carterae.AAC.1